jgi:hypothetical protein
MSYKIPFRPMMLIVFLHAFVLFNPAFAQIDSRSGQTKSAITGVIDFTANPRSACSANERKIRTVDAPRCRSNRKCWTGSLDRIAGSERRR